MDKVGRTRANRRSVLEQSPRYETLEARRTAFSVALVVFWRMRGEVQQLGTAASGLDRYESGLRDRPTDLKRACTLTRIPRGEHVMPNIRQRKGWGGPGGCGAPKLWPCRASAKSAPSQP
jgi:hypothetical protein